MMHFKPETIASLDKNYRTNLINGISGGKPACLIGTKDSSGTNNLAIFSNIIHIGANPALIGILFRPITDRNHTYQNIKTTQYFTLNHIENSFIEKAHFTSAAFPGDISEFDTCQLIPEIFEGFEAPFVKESQVKIGLKFIEEQFIKANHTILVIGQVEHIFIPKEGLDDEGNVLLETLNGVSIGGLNTYYKLSEIGQFPYAKTDQIPHF
jgi:flavin reductase (DIM6/NTAB) family NADH-FMN oxidoreductase RutF